MPLYEPGDTIADRYRVERELGSGGFGEVLEATEFGVNRRVAIKVLKPDDGAGYTPSTRARFEREARAVGQLQSPHTVTLLDFGEFDGKLFMVFELVPGEDLRTILIRDGRLEPSQAVHILRQLLDSLGEAHRAGILHRDIKPANIRVFPWGDNLMFVKLLDFGLARPTDDGSPGITATGEMIGTPRYMSPEQLSAKPLTPASDIYSLGIVFLEMLIGAAPLQGNRWSDQFDRMMTGHVFSFPELQRIGPDLVQLVHRMTARDPAQRFRTAKAVSHTLSGGRNDDRPTLKPEAKPDSSHRSPVGAVLLVAAVASLAIVGGFAWHNQSEAPSETPRPKPKSTLAPWPEPTPPAGTSHPDEPDDVGRDAASEAPPAPEGARRSAGCGVVEDDGEVWRPFNYHKEYPHPLVVFLPRDPQGPSFILNRSSSGFHNEREAFFLSTRFDELSETERFLVFIPPFDRGWPGIPGKPAKDREGRTTRENVEHIAANHCVDLARVFLVSDESAGRVAYPLACESWVTAIAGYAYLPESYRRQRCDNPVPTIWLTPTNSAQVPAKASQVVEGCGAAGRPTLAQWEEEWRRRNRCEGWQQGDPCSRGTECAARFTSCRLDGGFHWPGATAYDSFLESFCGEEPHAASFPIEEKIWSFFVAAPPLPDPDKGAR